MQQNFIDSVSDTPIKLAQRKQFLRFYLEPETTIMLPIEQITEVLKVSFNKIVAIPQMPPWIMGVYNWRGEILWTADLGHLLGLNTWQEQRINSTNSTVVILSYPSGSKAKSMQKKSLGLIINSVEDIEWCDPNLIQPPPPSAVTPTLAPFVTGYWLKPEGEMILVLDGNSIINAMN
ncbi:Chemotaxis signal transduction protein [Hyella patelloides LEGE 07179]|uniref:Chemotaxis signal transduction protein n=1 Tax=Hyella patelloides LEGE 07179 TaxID=945734 RepID=A0A563W4I3_9CYAN|nr:chemotaxis protein CheW [Hyella patelloides]VEP18594.1 Chemotaxis signal transduction protein [Hyella patelloides LEGE 07179]